MREVCVRERGIHLVCVARVREKERERVNTRNRIEIRACNANNI